MATRLEYQCQLCKNNFTDYPSNHRKYCSRRCAYLVMNKDYTYKCNECGKLFTSKIKTRRYCSMRCSGKNANRFIKNHRGGCGSGENHWNWKGGRKITGNLYKQIMINGKYIYEHRFIAERYLGRKLSVDEQVHHLNRNQTDNRIENLIVITDKWHQKLHHMIGVSNG